MSGRPDRDRNGNGNGGNNGGGLGWWLKGAGAAAVVGGLGNSEPASSSVATPNSSQQVVRERKGFLSSLADSLQAITENSTTTESAISRSQVPARPSITNLNSLLADIYVRYIALKKEDFQLHYNVFTEVFGRLHRYMKQVDKYYERYSSNVQFAGSHYDRLRIQKPDEFDMDIVIDVPVNMHRDLANPEESDIVIEPKYPGFVQLRAGTQYQRILIRDGHDCLINRTAYEWLDDRNYILRSKFTDWFKSVANRGLNQFQTKNGLPVCVVDGVQYTIRTSSGGPAWTIIIEAGLFRLDVDLVPALKFPENRWLEGRSYRRIPMECRRDFWMVVPKPNKSGQNTFDEQRSWRIALQDQEKQLLNNTYSLRQTIRLMKKLRDAQGMNKIASYYIKTLFFWEIEDKKTTDPTFWKQNDIATLFKHMVNKFYIAMDRGNIPYFWNKNHNMIENLNSNIKNEYKRKISALIAILENSYNYKLVAKYLLTPEEYNTYQYFL
ncbi:cyclic GMP-AMP synthase-like isoform X2 [Pararge aegeria]|uniref:cyclic GMP-AMP synthase-like isoform X2 n=1 Tax=Pararge aegeria TaxID=116150 RepID=UPI0019D0610F|nr:cyclic GMP-AMP synthase-like isoform X2 [Pararge aegeria]